jgi:hypothetical protein
MRSGIGGQAEDVRKGWDDLAAVSTVDARGAMRPRVNGD